MLCFLHLKDFCLRSKGLIEVLMYETLADSLLHRGLKWPLCKKKSAGGLQPRLMPPSAVAHIINSFSGRIGCSFVG